MSNLASKSYRLNNLYKIKDKESRIITFRENKFQKLINQDTALRKMILKPRQVGVSTNCLVDMFDDVLTRENFTGCILAHEKDGIEKLFRIVQTAYKNIPEEIKPVLDRGGGSKYEYYFPETNSRIYCDLDSRGDTINRLHISEVAFIKDPNRIKATLEAVPITTGQVTMETTPNGIGNYFYEKWIDPGDPYSKHFFPWFMFEAYTIPNAEILEYTDDEIEFIEKALTNYGVHITPGQIAFRRLKQSDLKELYIQEYPEDDVSCFLASGETAFDLIEVMRQIRLRRKPIESTETLKIYAHYEKGHTYVAGCDTAEGVGGDKSVCVIIDVTTRKVAAVLTMNARPTAFAEAVYNLCFQYRHGSRTPPLLGIERNNHGHAVIQWLNENPKWLYPNLYYRNETDYNNDRPGWVTDMVTRPLLINAFRDAVENQTIDMIDETILNECLTLVNNNGKIEAAQGKHDDHVIAAAIATQMLLENSENSRYSDKQDIDKAFRV